MNILMEFKILNRKITHQVAKELAQAYPGSRFAGMYGFPFGCDQAVASLRGNKDVRYEFLLDETQLQARALESEIDMEAIKAFEAAAPAKSLWRMVASDQAMGEEFIHDAAISGYNFSKNKTKEKILKYTSGLLKEYTRIFDEFKPDLLIPALTMGGLDAYVLEYLCLQRKVPYLTPMCCRIENFYSITEGEGMSRFFPHEATFTQLMNGEITLDLTEATQLYERLMADRDGTSFFGRQQKCFDIKRLDNVREIVLFTGKTALMPLKVIKDWIKYTRFRKEHGAAGRLDTWRGLWNTIKAAMLRQLNNYQMRRPGAGIILATGQKYLYFPLHVTPEYSTQFEGTMWMDQLHLIETLAKSIPADWVIYVKEHPSSLAFRSRPKDFYKRITRFPHVFLAPIEMDMNELISNAQMVATVTSTAGWEAVLRGVPSLIFGTCSWEALGLARRCHSLETLPQDIIDEYQISRQLSKEERKRRLIYFLAATIHDSFRVTYGKEFGNRDCEIADEIDASIGSEIGQAIIKYLERRSAAKELAHATLR